MGTLADAGVANSDPMIALAILVVVTMLILPMPKWLLDTFIVVNFAASIVIALMAAGAALAFLAVLQETREGVFAN